MYTNAETNVCHSKVTASQTSSMSWVPTEPGPIFHSCFASYKRYKECSFRWPWKANSGKGAGWTHWKCELQKLWPWRTGTAALTLKNWYNNSDLEELDSNYSSAHILWGFGSSHAVDSSCTKSDIMSCCAWYQDISDVSPTLLCCKLPFSDSVSKNCSLKPVTHRIFWHEENLSCCEIFNPLYTWLL